MVNFHPVCPIIPPNTCPAPRFPFLEESAYTPTTPVPALLPTDHYIGTLASGMGLMFLQQPHVWNNLLQQLGQHVSQKFSQAWEGMFNKKRPQPGTALIEACSSKSDWHAKAAETVFKNTLKKHQPTPASETVPIQIICPNENAFIRLPKTEQELNHFIDAQSTYDLDRASHAISQLIAEGQTDVINLTTGRGRTSIYDDIQSVLTYNMNLAPVFGLKVEDMELIKKKVQENSIDDELIEALQKKNAAIVRYVDKRLDHPDSAYNHSKKNYQQMTQNAASQGIAVVAAKGNLRIATHRFNAEPGADMNFLTEADHVIGVGASDDQGTPSPHDDRVSPFSSWGNGQHNPTILAPNVGIPIQNKHAYGTAPSALQVAAVIRAMRQADPNLTVKEITDILQKTATKLKDHQEISHGAGVINPELALQEVKRRRDHQFLIAELQARFLREFPA